MPDAFSERERNALEESFVNTVIHILHSQGSKAASGESSASRTATKEYDSPLASPHPAVRGQIYIRSQ